MSKFEKVSFEEALDLTGFGKFNLLTFLLCSSIIMGMAFELFSVAYLVPASACELATTSRQQGLMAAIPLIGVITTSHFWGYLADTRGRKKVLCFSMSFSFVAGAAAALSPDWVTFSVLKFMSSSSVSGAVALSIALLSECTPEAKRSVLIVLTATVFLSCNGIMAVLAIPVLPLKFSYYIPVLNIHFNSWRVLNLIFSFPCAMSAFGLLFSYESPKYLLSIGKEAEAMKILKGIFVMNNHVSAVEYPVESVEKEVSVIPSSKGLISSMVNQTVPLFKPPLLKNTILLSIIFVTVYICINPYMVWLPFMADGFMKSVERGERNLTFCQRLKASRQLSLNELEHKCSLNEFAMVLVLVIGALLGVVNVLITTVINRFGRKKLFIAAQFVAGASALLVNVSSVWYVAAIFFFAFISGVINFAMLSSFCVDLYPTRVKAVAVCLTLMVGRGSAVFGINLLKVLLDDYCDLSFYVFGSIAIMGGIIGFLLPGDTKPAIKRLPDLCTPSK